MISNLQKDFCQDNLSSVCLQFCKHNILNTLADNMSYCIWAQNLEMTVKDSHFLLVQEPVADFFIPFLTKGSTT